MSGRLSFGVPERNLDNLTFYNTKNNEIIIKHIHGGMYEKTNLFTVFGKKKSPSCHVPSISRSNTYCIYIFRKNIML